MPLRDHFHAPLGEDGIWSSIHGVWAAQVTIRLNRSMPTGYRALPLLRFGFEIDVATIEELNPALPQEPASEEWMPSAPVLTAVVAETEDTVAVRVYRIGPRQVLVGAIEFVSPSNKDRPAARMAFVAKYTEMLRAGVSVTVVDVVTVPTANLHVEIVRELLRVEPPPSPALYAVSYRPLRDDRDQPIIEVRTGPVALGQPLPTLPLWLPGGRILSIEFEATYEETCRSLLLTR